MPSCVLRTRMFSSARRRRLSVSASVTAVCTVFAASESRAACQVSSLASIRATAARRPSATTPQKSTSHATFTVQLKRFAIWLMPAKRWSPGACARLAKPLTPTCGKSDAPSCTTCALACRTRASAAFRLGFAVIARFTSVFSLALPKSSSQPVAAPAGGFCSITQRSGAVPCTARRSAFMRFVPSGLKKEHPAAGSITPQITAARLVRLKKVSKDIIAPFLAARPCHAMRNFSPRTHQPSMFRVACF